MVEEKDLPALHDHFNALEDDLNAIVREEELPTIYATIDLRRYAAADSLEVKEEKVVLHLCLHYIALTDFRAEVVRALTDRLSGVEGVPEGLVNKMEELREA